MNGQQLESYLVALGFKVDSSEFSKAIGAVKTLATQIQTTTSSMTKSFSTAAVGITGSITAIATATAGLIDSTGKADLEYQKLALRLFTTKQTAKDLKTVMDAMGEHDMNQIAWIPQLHENFQNLLQTAHQLQSGQGGNTQALKDINAMRLEVQRLKLEMTYAGQSISYYLVKDLEGLGLFKGGLKGMNAWIVQNMPIWTKKVADLLAQLIKLGVQAGKSVSHIVTVLEKFWKSLTNGQKELVELFGIITIFLTRGPTAKILAIVDAVLLLLNHLKKTGELKPLLDWFSTVWDDVKQSWDSFVDAVIQSGILEYFDHLGGKLGELVSVWWKEFKDVYGNLISDIESSLEKDGAWTALYNSLGKVGGAIDSLIDGFISVLKQMDLIAQNDSFQGFWATLGNELSRELKIVAAFVSALAGIGNTVGLLMQGKFMDAAAAGFSIVPQLAYDLYNSNFGNDNEAVPSAGGTAGKRAGNNLGGSTRSWGGSRNSAGSSENGRNGLSGGYNPGFGSYGNFGSYMKGGSGGDTVGQLMNAIGQKESGGDYYSPAHMDNGYYNLGGKYQILASNWSNWAEEAGLSGDAAYTPANQDTVARYKIQQYWNQYHDASLVAAAWNGGGGGAESLQKYGSSSYEAGYASDVVSNMNGSYASGGSSGGTNNYGGNLTASFNINVTGTDTNNAQQIANTISNTINQKLDMLNSQLVRNNAGVYA